jgi:ribosomal-protein-alanine N-acetyltransferase
VSAAPSLVLTTPRLLVSPLGRPDAERVARYLVENREHHGPWDPPRPEAFFTEVYWRDVLDRSMADLHEERAFRFWLIERSSPEGAVIGLVHFNRLVRGPFQCAGLGYSLDHRHQGRGLMREALHAALEWVFEIQRFHRVEASYRPENVRSGRTLAGLGFVVEGYAKNYLLVGDRWCDHVLTALTREEPRLHRPPAR